MKDQEIAGFASSYRVLREPSPQKAGRSAPLQWLCLERHTGQPMGHQRADIAVIAAFGRAQHRTVMFAERQERFFIAQAFEQRQAQGLARAFVLPGGILHATVAEGLGW